VRIEIRNDEIDYRADCETGRLEQQRDWDEETTRYEIGDTEWGRLGH